MSAPHQYQDNQGAVGRALNAYRCRAASRALNAYSWLSHVPASRFGQLWRLLGNLLAGNGRVLFIDEHVDERGKEAHVAGRDGVVERRLRDGSTFRVIKNFVDPEELELRLRRLGWDCVIRRDGSDWVCGQGFLAR